MNLYNMIQGNLQALVKSVNGIMVADSLQVADCFGKRHTNVIRAIESLITSLSAEEAAVSDEEWMYEKTAGSSQSNFGLASDTQLNFEPSRKMAGDTQPQIGLSEKYFIPSTYKDSTGRELKHYWLTRDGFSLLVMGFTGPAALHWKLLYIEAFNKMEEALKMQKANEQLIADAAELILKKVMPEIVKAVGSATAEIKKQIPKQEAEESPEGREINGRRMYSMYGNKEALPNLLTVYDVRDFLGIGQRQAYELVRSEGFPAKKLGNQYFIPKDGFLKWLDRGFI